MLLEERQNSKGSEALCGIRAIGGITIAQLPASAEHSDMSVSAIASGCVDYILTPEQIAAQLVRIIGSLDQLAD